MTYPHAFGKGSLRNLEGVHPDLAAVAALAITLCKYDGTIHPGGGVRTRAQAQANVDSGAGILDSQHRVQADGYGHAIDLLPLTPGKGVDWTNLDSFREMYSAVKEAAAILGIAIRQGADWNMNGRFEESASHETDLAHFELPKSKYRAAAVRELARHRALLGIDTEPNEEPLPEHSAEHPQEATCPHCSELVRLVRA